MGGANGSLKRLAGVIGIFAKPGEKSALNLIITLLREPAVKILPHDSLSRLIEVEHQLHTSENFGIVNRLHTLHSTMVQPVYTAVLGGAARPDLR